MKPTPNPIDEHVGKRIQQERVARGLTQTQVGEELGISFQQVQKYETGRNRISASKMFAFCQMLGIKPNDLFPTSEDAPVSETRTTSAEETELLRWYRAKDKSVRKALLTLISKGDEE